MTSGLERVVGIDAEVDPGDLDWLEHASYEEGTQLAVYVLERGAGRTVRCIAPRNPIIRVGDVVDDYGSWFYAVQVADSTGSDEEVCFAEAIRVRGRTADSQESSPQS